ncbi:hypothetical protein BH09ACT12_BH09ACT12_13840 [soil metagenome]
MTRYSDPDLVLTDDAVEDHVAAAPPASVPEQATVPQPTKGPDDV